MGLLSHLSLHRNKTHIQHRIINDMNHQYWSHSRAFRNSRVWFRCLHCVYAFLWIQFLRIWYEIYPHILEGSTYDGAQRYLKFSRVLLHLIVYSFLKQPTSNMHLSINGFYRNSYTSLKKSSCVFSSFLIVFSVQRYSEYIGTVWSKAWCPFSVSH